FQQAQQGQPQAVLLVGEAGIGKTRLATEFVGWARAQGADVLNGHALEMGGRLPYQPLVEALRGRLEGENAPEDLVEDLWLADLGRDLPVRQVALQPLSQAETRQLIEVIVGEQREHSPARPSTAGPGGPPSPEGERPLLRLGEILFAQTGGQPLYLLETLKL